MEDAAVALVQYVKQAMRRDMVGPYTAISPRAGADGTQVMRVKDARNGKMLTVTVKEDAE